MESIFRKEIWFEIFNYINIYELGRLHDTEGNIDFKFILENETFWLNYYNHHNIFLRRKRDNIFDHYSINFIFDNTNPCHIIYYKKNFIDKSNMKLGICTSLNNILNIGNYKEFNIFTILSRIEFLLQKIEPVKLGNDELFISFSNIKFINSEHWNIDIHISFNRFNISLVNMYDNSENKNDGPKTVKYLDSIKDDIGLIKITDPYDEFDTQSVYTFKTLELKFNDKDFNIFLLRCNSFINLEII